MARIRSIHPGLFTDEAWVSVSVQARWLAIGLLCEADDCGAFEWKPLQLKMRIFPVDTVDIAALLAELSAAEVVRPYTLNGRQYGALRNFCRFQRPRKPKSIHPMPAELRTFVAPGGADDEPDEAEG